MLGEGSAFGTECDPSRPLAVPEGIGGTSRASLNQSSACTVNVHSARKCCPWKPQYLDSLLKAMLELPGLSVKAADCAWQRQQRFLSLLDTGRGVSNFTALKKPFINRHSTLLCYSIRPRLMVPRTAFKPQGVSGALLSPLCCSHAQLLIIALAITLCSESRLDDSNICRIMQPLSKPLTA